MERVHDAPVPESTAQCPLRAHNDEIVGKGDWPALVPESTWRAAQPKLNMPGCAPGRKSVRRHLLTGLMRCGIPNLPD